MIYAYFTELCCWTDNQTTATMVSSVERLPIDRNLLNPLFEGYKLSFDEINIDERRTLSGVLDVKLPADVFSYQHAAAFSNHNSLIIDPWHPENVYYINHSMEIVGCCSPHWENERCVNARKVGQILRPKVADGKPKSNVCLNFISPLLAVISDGFGNLYVVSTSKRENVLEGDGVWKLDLVSGYNCPDMSATLHACTWKGKDKCLMEVIIVRVSAYSSSESQQKAEPFRTILEWLTICPGQGDDTCWMVERIRILEGKGAPYYAEITQDGQAISICSSHPYRFVSDSAIPVTDNTQSHNPAFCELPAYTWSQTSQSITIRLVLPTDTHRDDISSEVTETALVLKLKNGHILLQGKWAEKVDERQFNWTIGSNMIEMAAKKKTAGLWKEVMEGDGRGKEVSGEDKPSPMSLLPTSEELVSATDLNAYNMDQMEECDAVSEETSVWIRIDGDSHLATHKVDVSGNEYLFGPVRLEGDTPACLCLRHNVDGLLFHFSQSLETNEPVLRHLHTFDALGYVMASKQDRRFASCPPNTTFAALCDNDRNIFVYRSDVPLDSVLKNRQSGKIIRKVAKQHVITLKEPGPILGFAVNNSHIFVLKSDALFTVKL